MNISFYGAVGSVTGSCYLVQNGKNKFLVDCGMFQGCKELKALNYSEFAFDPREIDFVLVTHAHIDHTGLLPKLVKKGFKGPIYATEATCDLMSFLLPDSASIQESEVLQKNRRNERKGVEALTPIYTLEDAQKTIKLFRQIKTGNSIQPCENLTVVFRNAGHIFGSAFLDMTLVEKGISKKVVFSGDLGGKGHPIVQDPENVASADVLVLETTYGNRVRPNDDKEDRLQKLAAVLKKTLARGGNLIIPSFAVERTQDLLHDLMILMARKSIPQTDITVDSPLAINLTNVFKKYPELYDEEATSLIKSLGNLFDNPRVKMTRSADESRALNEVKGAVILSSSGMCDAGRIKHHLKHNLWRRDSTILFVGFQAEGTLGRLLMDGAKSVRIHGEEIKVEAEIAEIPGYSGHADQKGLLDWLSTVKTIGDKIFLVHGEDDARLEFSKKVLETRAFSVVIPKLNETYDLTKAVAVDVPTVETPPKTDSYNLYASLVLKLSDFMRSERDEGKRKSILEKLASLISN